MTEFALVATKNFEHAFGPCTSRYTVYEAAPTSLHERVPFTAALLKPFAGLTLVGADVGQPVDVDAEPELLLEFESGFVELALAVLTMVTAGPGRTMYVA